MARSFEQFALDRQLCFALYAASRAMTRAYGPHLDQVGLTYPQYVTMLALWDSHRDSQQRDGSGPLTVGELGSRLQLETGTLTPLLKRLEALGYVRRTRDKADERRVLVEVTDEGLALRTELAQVPGALATASGLDLDEIGDLRQRLVDLVHQLDAATGTSTGGEA